nr:hypothetical protein [Saprospiraceae bacterium]
PGHIEPGMDNEHMVSNVDLVPTVHHLLGLSPGALPGINALDKDALDSRAVVFSECYDHDISDVDDPTHSLLYQIAIEKKWKLVVPNTNFLQVEGTSRKDHINGRYYKDVHLFDLETDPEEMVNKVQDHPEIASRLMARIENWRHATPSSVE